VSAPVIRLAAAVICDEAGRTLRVRKRDAAVFHILPLLQAALPM
jgi:hypothetical protein